MTHYVSINCCSEVTTRGVKRIFTFPFYLLKEDLVTVLNYLVHSDERSILNIFIFEYNYGVIPSLKLSETEYFISLTIHKFILVKEKN